MAVSRAFRLVRVGVGSAALVSIPAMTYNFKVLAADKDSGNEQRIKITQLSLYDNPEEKIEYHFVADEISPLQQIISEARQAVWEYLDTVQEVTDKVKEKFETGKAHTEGLIDYLQNDPGVLPRAAVITVAGLGGVIAGYRGGVMRKLFLSSAAILAATSLCYPKEAVALSTEVYNITLDQIKSLWTTSGSESQSQTAEQSSSSGTANNKSAAVKPIKGDHGQSKEEDKDLYTTRSR